MSARQELEVHESEAGTRLDVFLAARLKLPRRYVWRLLRRERVQFGGHPARKGVILRSRQRVIVLPFRHPDLGPLASPQLEIPILAAAGGLVAVDKPAGLPTHPLDFEETRTVLNGLIARYPQMVGVGEAGLRSGLLHRLDNDTSGVLLFATQQEAWQRVHQEFEQRRVEKHYLARVHGHLERELELSLRLEARGPRVRVVSRGGRETHTRLRPLEGLGDSTLVEVRPTSGFRHQIRVTLAHLGHPVLGDRTYGSPLELGRHLLHATFIRSGEFSASSPAPAAFRSALPG